ncbi:hypothetical protein AAAK29_25775 [Mesorhizobium sp. CCNWLW179-1]|uniref:hypothetical protein n=1 Tax=Mesorhizobium TaxID=68287 RepID=UPI001FE527B0|nr:hypothetical protein [Mesorhizobium zhangyense]
MIHMPKRLQNRNANTVRGFSNEQWSMARRAARELDKVLDDAVSRQAAVTRAATELQLTSRQIYNLLGLLARSAASRRKRLPEELKSIIAATLRDQWLTLPAPATPHGSS